MKINNFKSYWIVSVFLFYMSVNAMGQKGLPSATKKQAEVELKAEQEKEKERKAEEKKAKKKAKQISRRAKYKAIFKNKETPPERPLE